jgi:hypothetical protein
LIEDLGALSGAELSGTPADVGHVGVCSDGPESAGLLRVRAIGSDEHRTSGVTKPPVEVRSFGWALLPPSQIDEWGELAFVCMGEHLPILALVSLKYNRLLPAFMRISGTTPARFVVLF